MDKDIAEAIVKEVLQQEASNSRLMEMCLKISDETLREKLIEEVKMIISGSQFLILRIERVYPDLNPDF